jgi:hypothetical protein
MFGAMRPRKFQQHHSRISAAGFLLTSGASRRGMAGVCLKIGHVIPGRCKASSRNLEIPRCATAHLRSALRASWNDCLWIASWSLSSGAHSRDPLARNDGPKSTLRLGRSKIGTDSTRKLRYRPLPSIASNTRRTSVWVSRTLASSDEKSGASPARASTRSRSSPAVSGLNLSLTQSRRICVRS